MKSMRTSRSMARAKSVTKKVAPFSAPISQSGASPGMIGFDRCPKLGHPLGDARGRQKGPQTGAIHSRHCRLKGSNAR
jgi:hypothetical protein